MLKLGIVTYLIAHEWDVDTIISHCTELEYDGVELRTTHAHGVEVDLSADARREVREKFDASPVELAGLGSAFEYHSADPEELRQNIEGTNEYVKLAADLGVEGVKVRPNAFPEDVPREKTIEQIGVSLREVASFAAEHGVKIRLEVHGRETCHPPYIRQILDIADHPNAYACWNSNAADLDESGSIDANFELLRDKIGLVHINELWKEAYPWQRLFGSLQNAGYNGFCLAEIPGSSDPERVLRYYKALFRTQCGTTS